MVRSTLRIAVDAAKAWHADNAFKHSAAVSFYTLFSLAPITLIAVAVTGFFFGEDRAQLQLRDQVSELVGKGSAEVIVNAMEAAAPKEQSSISGVIGAIVLAVAATTVFAQLQQSLNEIWRVMTKPTKRALLVMIIKRLISFAMVLTIGFLLLTSLVLSTALTAAVQFASGWITVAASALRVLDLMVGLGVTTGLFALMFKVLPDVRIDWREAWVGGFVTALLFTVGRFGISFYLGRSSVASAYGAAGSLVALLVWIYYSSAIFFYGVEIVRAHRLSGGRPVEPKAGAQLYRRELIADDLPIING